MVHIGTFPIICADFFIPHPGRKMRTTSSSLSERVSLMARIIPSGTESGFSSHRLTVDLFTPILSAKPPIVMPFSTIFARSRFRFTPKTPFSVFGFYALHLRNELYSICNALSIHFATNLVLQFCNSCAILFVKGG